MNWIFLRGWGRDSRHWGEFKYLVKAEFEQDDFHFIDIPGSGDYVSELCPTTIKEIVDIIARRWQNEYPGESAHIVALSFGGMLAIDWMTRYPQMIQSAVLMNISSRNLSPFYRRLDYKIYPVLASLLLTKQPRREAAIIRLTSNLYPSRTQLTEKWSQFAQDKPVRQWNLLRQLWAAANYSLPHSKPEQPILMLNSLSDRLVHPDCSKAIADAWNVPLQRHPTAGHDVTLDAPMWVLEQLKDWVKSQGY